MSKKITAQTKKTLDGNHAVAEALRQLNPDVFGFYPITPTSYVGQAFGGFVADGEVQTEFVSTESEHAAMSTCVGAAAAGGRAVTATASQGLILMAEVLWNAAGMRLPIVLINGNRALSAPLSIHCCHDDLYAVRDAGWVQLVARNAQEAYDLAICAFPIGEQKSVRTPVMVAMDCFHTTHTTMHVTLEPDATVQKFLGKNVPVNPLLDIEHPVGYGTFAKPDSYQEFKRAQLEGQKNALGQTEKIFEKYEKTFGRLGGGVLEQYRTDDAEIIFVVLGSAAATVQDGVDLLRESGVAAGMVRPKIIRPFPIAAMREALGGAKKIIVLDRCSPCGAHLTPLGSEVAGLALDAELRNCVYGLGSRETRADQFAAVAKNFGKLSADHPEWINLQE